MKGFFDYRSSKACFSTTRLTPCTRLFTAIVLLTIFATCKAPPKPPRKIKLPLILQEASGLSIDKETKVFHLHNDSGDEPNLYAFSPVDGQTSISRIPAQAKDWEDLTTDTQGRFYIADTGNNLGKRQQLSIYRYDPVNALTDSILFTYPGQDGGGRLQPGNFDCEALVHSGGQLHLFTKALPGRRKSYWAYHFTLPAEPGVYEAQLVDSLYLPRRVITAAALDIEAGELVLTTYNYKRFLGFLPVVASSLITLSDYPDNRFFRGTVKRRNLSWAVPSQYEAVDFYNDDYLYIATEKTIMRRQSLKRIRRR